MNWGREALDLYEKNLNKVGKIEYRGEFPYTLLPTFHSTATAQITVTIDEEGNFLHGEQVPANDKFTIIPVTEKSGSRTSGKEAHPLCDNLRYLAGDYPLYVADDGSCFEIYMEQLKKWYESEFCHDKVRAIYYYLQKKSLMHDLIEQKVLKQNEDGTLAEKETIQGIDQSKAFVRFIVRSLSNPLTETVDECWKDKTLWEKYQQYQRSMEGEKGLCYLSGKRESISYLQPKKIRNEGDGAKLISSNDKDNFTYRGRFATKEEAFAIGNETSQKVHNALKWIIRRQGGTYDTMVFATWETAEDSAGELEVRWDSDTEHIISEFDEWDTGLEDPEFDTNAIGAELFQKAMSGYRTLQNEEKCPTTMKYMVLLGVDAATPGRLAVVEAKKIEETRYLENIRKWHKDCWWRHEKWRDGKRIVYYGMVGIPLNAKTCPNALTSIHSLHAICAQRSLLASFLFPICFLSSSQPSARSFRLLNESSVLSSDCTKIFCPRSCRRFRIFRLMQTSEISPYPSRLILGRFPFSGSPLGFAFVALTNNVKSIFPFNSLISLFLLCFLCFVSSQPTGLTVKSK